MKPLYIFRNSFLAILGLISSCTPSTRIVKQDTSNYPYKKSYVEASDKPFEDVWSNLIDEIAKNGYPVELLDKENGLFLSGELTTVPYSFPAGFGSTGYKSPYIILPSLKYEELMGNTVEKSRTLYPDELSIKFNVRVRPHKSGGTYIIAKITNVSYTGSHYRVVTINRIANDTIVAKTNVKVERDRWSGWISTGELENRVIESIK